MECYRYEPSNDTWSVSGSLSYMHKDGAFTHHKDLGLVILGSYHYDNRKPYTNGSKIVENTMDGKTIQVY